MSKQTKQDVCPTGVVEAICISDKRGIKKRVIEEGHLLVDFDIEGDIHAGHWYRRVSLPSYDKIRVFSERGANVIGGAFGKSLVVGGINFGSLPMGTRLYTDTVLLEMTQVGKGCHNHYTIYKCMGECIMPKEGVFVRIIREGIIRPGGVMRVEPPAKGRPFTAAVITLSDKDARGGRKDGSGPTAKELLEAAGHEVVELLLLPGEPIRLETQFIRLTNSRQVDLVLTSGGTGFFLKDQTPEATMAVAERGAPEVAGFIRTKSTEATDRAMLSKGVSVIRGKTLIVDLPGSPRVVKGNLGFITGSLDHGLKILRGNASECARS